MLNDSAAIEECACPLCGCTRATKTVYRRDPFAVVRCAECRAWYLSPRLPATVMRGVYARPDYFEGSAMGYDSYASQRMSLRATFRRFLRSLNHRGITGGCLLDVGCGPGYLLDEAAGYFQERVGCDLAPSAVASVQSADAVYVGGPEAIPLEKRFDCIIATHVIEHVYEPLRFVQDLTRRLRDGGWLVLAAPDMNSFWRRLMGRRWPSFKYPEHVVFYDKATLTRLMRDAGLVSCSRVRYPHAFPLSEVCRKLGLPVPPYLGSMTVWLPATTIAIAGQQQQRELR